MVAGVVRQWGRIANFLFEMGRVRTPTALVPRKAARSAAWRANAPRSARFKRLARPTCRGGAHNELHRLERVLMPFAHFVDHGGLTLLVVQIMGRLANRCAVEDRPSGWRDPGQYRDGPFRRATTIEIFRAGPNMNRRIAIVGDRLSDGGTVNAHVGAPLPVVSISGTKTRSRLRSRPAGSDEDWFPDLSNSKKILFRDVK